MPRYQVILVAVIAIVAAVGGALLARNLTADPSGLSQAALTSATLLTPPRPIEHIALVDHDGQPFDTERLQDHWTLLFFGFTNCPDVCPATLTILTQVEKNLQHLPPDERPRIVLASVDPQRDTPEHLKKYISFFSPNFLGITGTQENVEAFTQALYVPVAIQELPNGGYTVDHSAAIFLIDPDGAMRALFSTPHDAGKIAADFQRIAAV